MSEVIQLKNSTSNTRGFVLVDNLYIRDYFKLPLFTTGKVEHGKNIFDIALMSKYWKNTDSVKTNVSEIAAIINMNRRTIDKYIKSDLLAYESGKQCQIQDLEKVGKNIKLHIRHKPVQKYFTLIPMEIISNKILTALEKKIYIVLLFYSNNDDGVAWVSRNTLSEACGADKSLSKITKAIQALETADLLSYITIQKPNGQKKNFYKPLLVVENGKGVIRRSKNIYVSPNNVKSALGIYITIGEKISNDIESEEIINNQVDDIILDEEF